MIKHKVTLFIGHKRKSGKDTFADYLQEELDNIDLKHYRTAFANPIKEAFAAAHDTTVDEVNYLKNTDNGKTRNKIIKFSAKMESMFKDIWKKITEKEFESVDGKVDVILVSDFRFKAEYEYFKEKYEPITLKVHRRDVTDSTKPEIDLDDYEFDITVDNTEGRTLDDLREAAKEIALILETVLINKYMADNDKEWCQNRFKKKK